MFFLSVSQHRKNLCELVCLQAVWFYLSKATTSAETTKTLKSGWRGRNARHEPLGLFFVFFLSLLYGKDRKNVDVKSSEARCHTRQESDQSAVESIGN